MSVLSKTCTSCGESKPLESFAKNGTQGRHTSCKACACEKAKIARLRNIEDARDKDKARYIANKESRLAASKHWYEQNKASKLQREKNRYQIKAEQIKLRCKEYRQNNKPKIYALNGIRRAKVRQASPSWADQSAIARIYEEAERISRITGIRHHVDHVIPLNGETVTGLHVPENLAVIPWYDNLSKGASYQP